MNDPIGDMLTRIRNASLRGKSTVETPASKLRAWVLDVLADEGYIRGYEKMTGKDGHPAIEISLKYYDGTPVIREVKRVSKPGRRVYLGVKDIPIVRQGLGVSIVSTPRGVTRMQVHGPTMLVAKCSARSSKEFGMSRIGKKPVGLPSGVSASVSGQTLEVKGPKATRSFTAADDVTITVNEDNVSVEPRGKSKRARQQWGMSRTMIANMVTGVFTGFKKELEINGVGYRAQVQGSILKLSLGYSHDVNFEIPEGVLVTAAKPTEIAVEGTDEQLVGQVAANIREWRKPEPYKGKGIRYKGEYIFRKEGKKK
jgi:large subunit ribosomal protein L6